MTNEYDDRNIPKIMSLKRPIREPQVVGATVTYRDPRTGEVRTENYSSDQVTGTPGTGYTLFPVPTQVSREKEPIIDFLSKLGTNPEDKFCNREPPNREELYLSKNIKIPAPGNPLPSIKHPRRPNCF